MIPVKDSHTRITFSEVLLPSRRGQGSSDQTSDISGQTPTKPKPESFFWVPPCPPLLGTYHFGW
jgi:hypothetical protein